VKYVECSAFPLCITYSNSSLESPTNCVNTCYYEYTTDVCDSPQTGVEEFGMIVLYNTQDTVQDIALVSKTNVESVITCSERFTSCSSEVLGFLQSTPEAPGSRVAIVFQNAISSLDNVANIFLEVTIVITDQLILFNPFTSIYGNYGCLPIGGAANADFKVVEAGEGSYSFSLSLADFQTFGVGNYYFFIENDHNNKVINAEFSYIWQVIRM